MPHMSAQRLVGCRIVVRYRREQPAGGPPHSDLVGELTSLTSESLTVATRRGPVTLARSAVLALRPVAASRRDILELARISRRGWRAAEQVDLHGWLLCADRGWTGRANSILPLRSPELPLAQLLDAARAYYASRGLALQIQLPLPARDRLDAELAARNWRVERRSVVLTRTLPFSSPSTRSGSPVTDRPVTDRPASGYQLETSARPDAEWLAGYHYRGAQLPEHAVQLLTRHDRPRFSAVRAAGRLVAIARGTVDEGWLGISSVEVAADHRRRGLAAALMRELADWGIGQGARRCYLQVDESNAGALALYDELGFTEHHRYHYRIEPDPGADEAAAGPPGSGATPDRRRPG
jgi:ribosomal protein S18 acetylase RimI-like enzyme